MKVQKYLLLDQIGSGSYSTVYKAEDTETKEIVAIKKMREMARNDQVVVQNQINLLKRIRHNNIVRYIDDFKQKQKWYIVFEYCGKGDLEKFKKKQGRLPEFFCKNLMYSLVDVLAVLHQEKIVHRDLKLANILINGSYDLKLADFGFSKDNQSGCMQSFCGTPYAMAPQILRMQPYDDKCDTWSLGIMLYQMLYGGLPFAPGKNYGAGIPGLANCVLNAQPHYDNSVQISEQGMKFMKQCLVKDKDRRPSACDLRNHPWFKSGIQSCIRRDFLSNSLDDKTDVKNIAQQIFNGAVQQHITKIIKEYKLVDSVIKSHLKSYDEYYSQKNKITRNLMLLMIGKVIEELAQKNVRIVIEQRIFQVPLKNINTFQTHIKNLTKLLTNELEKPQFEKPPQKINLQRQIYFFVAEESDACLRLLQNFPKKNQFLLYIAQLPLYLPQDTQLKIQWSFNDANIAGSRKRFNNFIQKLTQSQILKFINESYCHEDIHSNWLIEQRIAKQMRKGQVITLGEFILNVIKINLSEDKDCCYIKEGII